MGKSQSINMKQQGNSSSSKANSTTKDLTNSKEEEISNTEFQKIIVRLISSKKKHKSWSNLKDVTK
jgi:hypothetical protein